MNKEVINLAKDIGIKIQGSDEFLSLKNSKEKMDSNEPLNELKQKFNSIKEEINKEISNENSDKDKIKRLSDELRSIYEKINDHPSVCEYETCKKNVDDLVQEVISIINEHAYGKYSPSSISCLGDCSNCVGC